MSELNEIFGSYVFNDSVMRERLPKATYKALKKTIEEGKTLSPEIADVVASAMKDWALEKGATHYTHWFQPMTGITAEKHDAFINPTEDGRVILEFSGKELIKGEPDASSFPSGGLRATFEARGYTAWDCTSPAFVKDNALCIPTAFCSYNGEALDKKTPLLRSMEALSVQAMRVLKAIGNTTAKRVITTVGPEQEYFLIDKNLYEKRKDLILTGRTLFGAMASKGQELEDHYFGTIKERVSSYMKELDEELWKLGIAAKTKHNEVAPAQHELAPIFSTTNIATDHNQLTMEIMKKVALRHGLVCLLHEKPFAGVNGSGKHNNWSMATDDGENLLEPGKSPESNTQFLLFLSSVIAAVDEYAGLLRLSAASAGNDHRLGANEAPPAIISIFLGEQLDTILREIEEGKVAKAESASSLEIGVSTLPLLPKDATDRNRTSPFAFTGNKFEFRMTPSAASISGPNFVLNTAVAEILERFADRLEKATDVQAEMMAIIKETVKDHKRIIFNGNGYSDEWVEEAERRGLKNIPSTVEAAKEMIDEKNMAVLEKHGVLTREESESRYEITLENYSKTINIEALTSIEMVRRQILPVAVDYATNLAASINEIKATGIEVNTSVQGELLVSVSNLASSIKEKVDALEEAVKKAEVIEDSYEMASAYRNDVFAKMNSLREDVDTLETEVDSEIWPLPTYSELLFNI
ncbi:glutamine synthetase III [Clostridium bornimense]|uniref:glutamine synthetase III family protein n=1 Tax=Clostridium bornimense TaxID=1216932 RepID=UPI001C115102|nr:glutamine synthetase III [Clostridium bornimense]MBU5317515.1 glutamine synthetase III [Clostridium bornimense]